MTEPSASLLKRTRVLEIIARRNVSSILSGEYLTGVPGEGLEFHEARHYVPGDPVRHIDWNMTARMDEPYVRTYLEEREREVIVAVDVSPSMRTGWQERTKIETAVEIAATLAASAVSAGDKVGLVTFDDAARDVLRPRSGRAQLMRVVRSLLERMDAEPRAVKESDPRAAIHAVQAWRNRRFVVFLVSDFVDHDVPEDLAYMRRQHDVSLLHVFDPLEYPPDGSKSPLRMPVFAPEGPRNAGWWRPGDTEDFATVTGFLGRAARKRGIFAESISTADPVGPALAAFFHHKRAALTAR